MALKKSEAIQQKKTPNASGKSTPDILLKKLLAESLDADESAVSMTHEFLKGYELSNTLEGAKAAIVALDEVINKALMHYP